MTTTTSTAMPAAKAVYTLNRPMITLAVMLATIIQTLDSTIANVALPHMQGSLSASSDQITWVLTSYIVAAAIATPLTGWLCDRFSQKSVFMVAVAGFTIASVLCGLSDSLLQIVLARLLQGLFGAALVPLSQAVMLEINTAETRGSAMAIWGMGVMVGPIIGPTLGGWLTDSYDWRWVFFINLPIGALAFYGIWRYMETVPARRGMNFDSFGFAMVAIAIGSLQMLLDRGEQNDWLGSTETWVELLLFVISTAFMVAHIATTPRDKAFIDVRVFRDRNYATGVFFIFIVGAVLYATRALTPPMLQGLMGYPVAAAGLVTAPSGAGTMLAMFVVGKLVGKVDLRLLLACGFGVTAFSLWQMTHYTLVLSEGDIIWPGLIQGMGLGLVFVPLSAASFSTLAPTMFAQATSTYSLLRNIGSSIGISMVQTLLVRNTQIAHSSLAEKVTAGQLALQGLPGSAGFTAQTAAGLETLNNEVTRQALMIAYVDDFILMFMLTLAMIPLLLLIKPAKRSAGNAAAAAHAVAD